MGQTNIAWANQVSNPWTGCRKKSKACTFCYAEAVAERFGGNAFPNGFELTWKWNELDRIARMRKSGQIIFVCSMSDFFLEDREFGLEPGTMDAARDRCLEVYASQIANANRFLLLTKRIESAQRYLSTRRLPPNIWLGVTVESPNHYDRIHTLTSISAAVRFLSIEPILAPMPSLPLESIDWVIVGGESGSHLNDPKVAEKRAIVHKVDRHWQPRPDRIGWITDIQQQCREQGAAFFMKQWGGATPNSAGHLIAETVFRTYPSPKYYRLEGFKWK